MKNKSGSAMLWAVLTAMMLLIFGMAVITVSYAYVNRSYDEHMRRQAYFTARSAVNTVASAIENGDISSDTINGISHDINNPTPVIFSNLDNNLTGGTGSCSATLLKTDASTIEITANATYGGQSDSVKLKMIGKSDLIETSFSGLTSSSFITGNNSTLNLIGNTTASIRDKLSGNGNSNITFSKSTGGKLITGKGFSISNQAITINDKKYAICTEADGVYKNQTLASPSQSKITPNKEVYENYNIREYALVGRIAVYNLISSYKNMWRHIISGNNSMIVSPTNADPVYIYMTNGCNVTADFSIGAGGWLGNSDGYCVVFIIMDNYYGTGNAPELIINSISNPEKVHIYIYGNKGTKVTVNNSCTLYGALNVDTIDIGKVKNTTFTYHYYETDLSKQLVGGSGTITTGSANLKWEKAEYVDD